MNKALFILLSLVVFTLPFGPEASAKLSPDSFPQLAMLSEGKIYLLVYSGKIPGGLPEKLYAYSSRLHKNKGELFGPFEATKVSGKTETLDEQKMKEFPNGISAVVIYKTAAAIPAHAGGEVLIFSEKKDLTLNYEDNTPVFKDKKSEVFWKKVPLMSGEGSHQFLQTYSKGHCLRSVDYYFYVAYDTGSEPESKFKEAGCGKKVDPFDIHL